MMERIDQFWIDSFETDKEKRENCCGCSNCANVCPVNAIKMDYDTEGYLYPRIDNSKCINCSACFKVCPLHNKSGKKNDTLDVYASYSQNKDIIRRSASGGFISELSRSFARSGGLVFGVRYNEAYTRTEYACANNEKELLSFSSSKYVQSEKNDVFKHIKNMLEIGRNVLVTGCPCDLASLKHFLHKDFSNLYTCELVCAGVTSPYVLEQYISYVEHKCNSKISSLNMRSKKYGWYVSTLEEHFIDGTIRYTPFYGSFLGHAFSTYVRPSCLKCQFRGANSTSDFRVGDFWGIRPTDSFWNKNGVSCVFAATERAQNIINNMNPQNVFVERLRNYDSLIKNESIYENKSEKYISKRNQFAEWFIDFGLIRACKETETFSYKVKRYIPGSIQPKIKEIYHYFIDRR